MRDFRILGSLEVAVDQHVVPLGGPRQRTLLAILLVARREPVPADRLIDRLWGEAPPPTAAKTVQVYVSHLRAALGSDTIVTRGNGYQLVVDADEVDSDRFESQATEGRRALIAGDAASARELLASALALWRGDALTEFASESWSLAEIRRLDEARLVALEDRIDTDLALGSHRDLVGELETLVSAYPVRERFAAQLMLTLYRCGRQADALDFYRQTRRVLDDELGLEPGPELKDVERRILAQDRSLEAPGVVPPTPADAVSRSVSGRRWWRLRTSGVIAGGALLVAAAVTATTIELSGGHTTGHTSIANAMAVIDTSSNHVSGWVPVGAQPGSIAFGAGSLWVANVADDTVSRVDPSSLQTTRTLSVHAPPTGIAVADGHVWVATSNASQADVEVDRIDPQYDVLARTVRLRASLPGGPGVVAADNGSLWAAPTFGLVARLNAKTGQVLSERDPNSSPSGIAVGDGSVWTTDNGANTVSRIESSGLVTSDAVGDGPSGVATTVGAVWVADTGDNDVAHLNPTTGAVTTTIPSGSLPLGVATGAGSVWVANSGDGTVSRIDPADDKVVATIPVGGSPQALTVADGRVWVTVDARTVSTGALTGALRIDASGSIGSPGGVDFMDPALAYESISWQLLYPVCAKLLNYPDQQRPAGSRLIPEVAQSLPSVTDGGKDYAFTIRPGFQFSPPSNQVVSAQTFKDSIERTLNPRMRSPVGGQLNNVVGVRAYRSGKAAHITGVTAIGTRLTLRLLRPEPDLLSRLAEPFFCAVPRGTPVNPAGVPLVPSAGPYYVTSYTPNQAVTLVRNPNYHGDRPRLPARIDVTMGVSGPQAIGQVEAGTADLLAGGAVPAGDAGSLDAKYGPGSPAARAGHQQYFSTPTAGLDFLSLDSQRPLFAQPRLRRAVNYAIDRTALARLGANTSPSPDTATSLYIPPGVPGYSSTHVYPLRADPAAARRLAAPHRGRTAVLFTCESQPCAQHAQIIKSDLAPLGIHLMVRQFPINVLYAKVDAPHPRFDIADITWDADYIDPDEFMNFIIEDDIVMPPFADARVRRQLNRAAELTGTARYLAYSRLDRVIARRAAPLVAYGDPSSRDLFSARVGCQTYGPYGADLGALCIRK